MGGRRTSAAAGAAGYGETVFPPDGACREAQLNGSIIFTECSYGKKLRLIARVKRQDLMVRVQKAITDPFVVKDRRSELNAKSYLPSKGDALHRLKKISQKGKRCSVLAAKNITTVKQLMRRYHEDKSGLQKLTGMKNEDWSTMIEHATTCDPGDEIYSYRVAEENCELLSNDFYDLAGIIVNGSYVPVRNLDQFQQNARAPARSPLPLLSWEAHRKAAAGASLASSWL